MCVLVYVPGCLNAGHYTAKDKTVLGMPRFELCVCVSAFYCVISLANQWPVVLQVSRRQVVSHLRSSVRLRSRYVRTWVRRGRVNYIFCDALRIATEWASVSQVSNIDVK